jgi:hypothetical protein
LLNAGKGAFTMSRRGEFERDWVLNEEDHLQKFKGHVALHDRGLGVELMAKCVHDAMLKDVALEALDGFGIKLPVPKKQSGSGRASPAVSAAHARGTV